MVSLSPLWPQEKKAMSVAPSVAAGQGARCFRSARRNPVLGFIEAGASSASVKIAEPGR